MKLGRKHALVFPCSSLKNAGVNTTRGDLLPTKTSVKLKSIHDYDALEFLRKKIQPAFECGGKHTQDQFRRSELGMKTNENPTFESVRNAEVGMRAFWSILVSDW